MAQMLFLFATLLAPGVDDVIRPDLRGVVLDQDGQPVERAAVFVYTAGPRRGTSPY